MELTPLTPDSPGFDQLLAESRAEGHQMLLRFADNWRNGTNLFDRPGELFLGARQAGQLIGVCGRNVDPFDPWPRAGRVRHLYVAVGARRQGVGAALLARVINGAAAHFDYLNTFAPDEAFPFYERLGFRRLIGFERVTHRLALI